MLLMVEEGIRGGICHSIHRYAKANNKYMKNYNNNEESSYIQYLDANNLYGWTMSNDLHSDLPFLPERMEVNKRKKLVCNLFNKKKYVAHINTLKQAWIEIKKNS